MTKEFEPVDIGIHMVGTLMTPGFKVDACRRAMRKALQDFLDTFGGEVEDLEIQIEVDTL